MEVVFHGPHVFTSWGQLGWRLGDAKQHETYWAKHGYSPVLYTSGPKEAMKMLTIVMPISFGIAPADSLITGFRKDRFKNDNYRVSGQQATSAKGNRIRWCGNGQHETQ